MWTLGPAGRFSFLRSVMGAFLTIHFSDKLRLQPWAGTGKALENLKSSVVRCFLKWFLVSEFRRCCELQ